MLRTGDEYRESIRDGREVWINGEKIRGRHHPPRLQAARRRPRPHLRHAARPTARRQMTYVDEGTGERCAIGLKLPMTRSRTGTTSGARSTASWTRSAASSPASATRPSARCGRSTTARTCSTRSTRASPRTSAATSPRAITSDPFHVSANTDPKGDRSKRPQDQDPDMLLHVVKETDTRHRRPRRQVRDGRRLRQPGLRQADDRQLGRQRALRLRRRLHRRYGRAGAEAHLPHRLRRPRAGRGLPALQPLRRGRHPPHLRRCR